jgi:hypothetical protein
MPIKNTIRKSKPWRWVTRHQYLLSFVGILIYNNWVVAFALNLHATLAGATTSELSAHGQPWAWLFRSADFTSGILLLLGMGIIAAMGTSRAQKNLLRFLIFMFGGSTILEVFLPLDCASSLSKLCAQDERLGLISPHHLVHLYESPPAYMLMFLLPAVIVWTIRRQPRFYKLKLFSWFLMLFMLIWGIETLIRFRLGAASYGYEQRLFNIIFTAWFIFVLHTAFKETRGIKHGARRSLNSRS